MCRGDVAAKATIVIGLQSKNKKQKKESVNLKSNPKSQNTPSNEVMSPKIGKQRRCIKSGNTNV